MAGLLPVGHALAIVGAGLVATLHILWGLGAGVHASIGARWALVLVAVAGAGVVLAAGRHIPWGSRWAGQAMLWLPFVVAQPAAVGPGVAYATTAALATLGDLTTIRLPRR